MLIYVNNTAISTLWGNRLHIIGRGIILPTIWRRKQGGGRTTLYKQIRTAQFFNSISTLTWFETTGIWRYIIYNIEFLRSLIFDSTEYIAYVSRYEIGDLKAKSERSMKMDVFLDRRLFSHCQLSILPNSKFELRFLSFILHCT